MVPAAFQNFFIASAQTSAVVVGLLFVAVSIAPQRTIAAGAPVERRAVALSAYTTLLNAFFLSLVAILPHTDLGSAALPLSAIGLANQCYLAWDLFRHTERTWQCMGRGAFLVVAGLLLLYEGELYNALLLLSADNSAPISALANLLIGIYALGLTRAWQLLGGHSHGLGEWLSPLHASNAKQAATDTQQSLSEPAAGRDKPG